MKSILIVTALLLIAEAGFAQKKKGKAGDDIQRPPDLVSVLLAKHGCSSCHHMTKRIVGPPFEEVARKNYETEKIVALIAKPEPKNWPGYAAMPTLLNVPGEDALKIAEWVNSLSDRLTSSTVLPR